MEATTLSVKSILVAAFDCAFVTTKSFLDDRKIEYDENDIKIVLKQKMDFILEDSGVKANILGKAATIDQALSGKTASANRNANWMTTQYTVSKLDEDVNRLRMLLSSQNITQETRVLNSCFKVRRDPNKSSSYITCTKLLKEKLKRGEVIEVADDVEEKVIVTDTIDWKAKFEKLKTRFQEKYDSWVVKARKVTSTVRSMQMVIANQQQIINSFEEKQIQKELEYKNRIEALISSIKCKIESKQFNTETKNDYIQELDMTTVIDTADGMESIEEFIHKLVDDYSDSTVLLQELALRLGLLVSFE
uniref:Non-structural protein 3 n=1 Tax=Rotavirus A TaxID=28875 RepID=A0A6G8MVQ4_9REOV|nr:NSP3 [Rotavirus A]QIN53343.1 NSP3 [Rotavirus A]QIN53354.1 NSP3 [Rotavirus A]